MNCQEFQNIGLDAERDASLNAAGRGAAREHAASCARCAALQASWAAAGQDLRLYAAATNSMEAPPRVAMRLQQELRIRRTVKVHRFAGWFTAALATASVLVGFIAWHDWRLSNGRGSPRFGPDPAVIENTIPDDASAAATEGSTAEQLTASANESDFVPLPGTLDGDLGNAEVLRVRMQRGSLAAWGFPVSEERADEWVQLDLLVGDDDQPQAVRLIQ